MIFGSKKSWTSLPPEFERVVDCILTLCAEQGCILAKRSGAFGCLRWNGRTEGICLVPAVSVRVRARGRSDRDIDSSWLRSYRSCSYWRCIDPSKRAHSNGAQGILVFED